VSANLKGRKKRDFEDPRTEKEDWVIYRMDDSMNVLKKGRKRTK